MADIKRISLAIDKSLEPWISYAAALEHNGNQTAYINAAILRDRDNADGERLKGFKAFLKARETEE